MKKLLICLFLSAAICAPSETRAAPATPQKVTLKWPTFRQTASKKSDPTITALQYLLRSRGFYHSKPDGVFGAQTAASVRAFQRKNGLKADGIVAAQTFSRLVPTLKRGDKGDAVRAFQTLMKSAPSPHDGPGAYDDLKVDDTFGSETESYLRSYQSDVRDLSERPFLKANGVVGAWVWCGFFGGQLN